jgi:hypothetical protein
MKEVDKFLTQLVATLSRTIAAWDSFLSRDIGIFSPSDASPVVQLWLQEIDKHFKELREFQTELEATKIRTENFRRQVRVPIHTWAKLNGLSKENKNLKNLKNLLHESVLIRW